MKLWKFLRHVVLIILVLALALTLFFVFVRVIKNEPFDEWDMDTWHNKYNMVFEWEALRINSEMSYEDIYKLLGQPNRTVGTGSAIDEYACFGGRYLYVYVKQGQYRFEEAANRWWSEEAEDVDRITPGVVCLAISSVVVFGGYALTVFYRRRKATLASAPCAELNIPVSKEN